MDFGNLKLLDLIAIFKENFHLIKNENLRKFANLGIELLDLYVNSLKKLDATDDEINQTIEKNNELPKIDVSKDESKSKSKIFSAITFGIELVTLISDAVDYIRSCFSKNGNEKILKEGSSYWQNGIAAFNLLFAGLNIVNMITAFNQITEAKNLKKKYENEYVQEINERMSQILELYSQICKSYKRKDFIAFENEFKEISHKIELQKKDLKSILREIEIVSQKLESGRNSFIGSGFGGALGMGHSFLGLLNNKSLLGLLMNGASLAFNTASVAGSGVGYYISSKEIQEMIKEREKYEEMGKRVKSISDDCTKKNEILTNYSNMKGYRLGDRNDSNAQLNTSSISSLSKQNQVTAMQAEEEFEKELQRALEISLMTLDEGKNNFTNNKPANNQNIEMNYPYSSAHIPEEEEEDYLLAIALSLSSNDLTDVKIKLLDGSELITKFKINDSIMDVKKYINQAKPQFVSQPYNLYTSFPKRKLEDSDTIQKSNLMNSVVIMSFD